MKHCELLNQDSKLVTQFDLPDNDVIDDKDDNYDKAQLFSACHDCLGLVLCQKHQGEFAKVS